MTDRCTERASHRATWPGDRERLYCRHHIDDLEEVAAAMGFALDVRLIEGETIGEARCEAGPGRVQRIYTGRRT